MVRPHFHFAGYMALILAASALFVSATATKNPAASPVVVKGIVVKPDGTPLPDALVCYRHPGAKLHLQQYAGTSGRFELELAPGQYDMWSAGAKIKMIRVNVSGNGPNPEISLPGRFSTDLDVRFERPDGTLLTSAYIRGCSYSPKSASGGSTCIISPNGVTVQSVQASDAPVGVLFAASGIGFGKLEIRDDKQVYETKVFRVRLRTGTTVKGVVKERVTGKPAGGVLLVPFRKNRDEWRTWNSLYGSTRVPYSGYDEMVAVSLDGTGAFSLGPLPPGDYRIVLATELSGDYKGTGFLPEVGKVNVSVRPGQKSKAISVSVPHDKRAVSISGRMVNVERDGAAIANTEVKVRVNLVSDLGPNGVDAWLYSMPRRVVTDSNGNYRLYPILPGKYWLSAVGPGGADQAHIEVKDKSISGVNFGLHLE